MGDPVWTGDDTVATAAGRRQHQEELDTRIQAWTSGYDPYELTELLQEHGVAAMPSFSAGELFSDSHLRMRGSITQIQHPVLGSRQAISPPWVMSKTPARITRTAPLIGADNEYVLGELLGLDADEIAALAEKKVVY
jgi:benzylsuccinate CoA-transferase BbsF subunit